MKKVTISSKCIKNPWIYRADKQANSTINKNVHCRAFTTLDNYACLWILNMQSRHLVPLAPLSIGAGKAVHIQ